jgi:FMN phosphatase YigB (HAD superfamily)
LPAPRPESQPPAVKHLLIDAGGVLVAPHPERVLAALASRSGRPASQLAGPLWDLAKPGFDLGRLDGAGFASLLAEATGLDLPRPEWQALWCNIFDDLPPMEQLVSRLSHIHSCYLFSNTDPWHLEHFRARLPFLAGFRGFHPSYEAGCAKPDPRYYRLGFERFGLVPEQCVLIDDRVANVEAAIMLGARGIVHRDAGATREALIGLGIAGTA